MIKDEFAQELPTKDELREFIHDSPSPVNKREIARAFGLKGQARVMLKAIIKELMVEGAIEKDTSKRLKF